jgi:hypothetical protein
MRTAAVLLLGLIATCIAGLIMMMEGCALMTTHLQDCSKACGPKLVDECRDGEEPMCKCKEMNNGAN